MAKGKDSRMPEELAEALRNAQATMPELREIAQLTVTSYVADASSLMRDGAVLLGITTSREDTGDGFAILVGLPRGTVLTGHLSTAFQGMVGMPV